MFTFKIVYESFSTLIIIATTGAVPPRATIPPQPTKSQVKDPAEPFDRVSMGNYADAHAIHHDSIQLQVQLPLTAGGLLVLVRTSTTITLPLLPVAPRSGAGERLGEEAAPRGPSTARHIPFTSKSTSTQPQSQIHDCVLTFPCFVGLVGTFER